MLGSGAQLEERYVIPAEEPTLFCEHTRLEAAVSVLNALGGLAELEQQNGNYVIQGYSCPLAAVVPGHPEICRLAESLLTELVGVPVQEQCDRNEKVRCRFVVPAS